MILCDKNAGDVQGRIQDTIRMHEGLVLSSTVYFVSGTCCLYVVVLKGEAVSLTALADRLTSINGVRHGKLLMSRVD